METMEAREFGGEWRSDWNEEVAEQREGRGSNSIFGDHTSSTPTRQSLITSKSMASYFKFFGPLMETMLPLSFLCPSYLATNASSSQYMAVAESPSSTLSATTLLRKAAQDSVIRLMEWNGYAMIFSNQQVHALDFLGIGGGNSSGVDVASSIGIYAD
nr:protein indeterminate-domain 2-like [Ipomoea batatas]